jgi:hypothetical protein
MKNLLRRGGLSDLLSTNLPVTPRGFLLAQRFVTDGVALRTLAALAIERLTSV